MLSGPRGVSPSGNVTSGVTQCPSFVTWDSVRFLSRCYAPVLTAPSADQERPLMQDKTRRVAILGGNRIPFARSNTVYAAASNQEMLTAALDGLVARFNLEGERLGEVA